MPVIVVAARESVADPALAARQEALEGLGVEVLIADPASARCAFDGARHTRHFLAAGRRRRARRADPLDAGLVDRILLFTGAATIGKDGVASPFVSGRMPDGFSLRHTARYGADSFEEYERDD